jgi:hypothetical protein
VGIVAGDPPFSYWGRVVNRVYSNVFDIRMFLVSAQCRFRVFLSGLRSSAALALPSIYKGTGKCSSITVQSPESSELYVIAPGYGYHRGDYSKDQNYYQNSSGAADAPLRSQPIIGRHRMAKMSPRYEI